MKTRTFKPKIEVLYKARLGNDIPASLAARDATRSVFDVMKKYPDAQLADVNVNDRPTIVIYRRLDDGKVSDRAVISAVKHEHLDK
jgi:hypothetical protein